MNKLKLPKVMLWLVTRLQMNKSQHNALLELLLKPLPKIDLHTLEENKQHSIELKHCLVMLLL